MRILALVALLAALTCWAQEPASHPQPPAPAPIQSPAASQQQTVTIPAGTRIPLALTSTITTKARPGNAVRAVTGFPVTVGTQLALPVGTYAEGVIDRVTKSERSGPSLQMHFTRLVYANGYSVAIEAANTQAKARSPKSTPPELSAFAGEKGNSLTAGASPQLPVMQPLPSHTGAIVGLAVGAAATAITIMVLGHYHRGSSGVLFDAGWQFEMVLQSPLSVDSASVSSARSGELF